jgi:arylsulfatase A-like enzyme
MAQSLRHGFIGLLILLFAGMVSPSWAQQAARRPNIVLIMADDLGYGDLSIHGCKDIPTPHIDSLAKNGVRCTSGYVSGPYCSPTRAALMTGRYQQRYGHEFNPGPPADKSAEFGLSLKETTVADRLKAAGYRTGMVGKWHLGHLEKFNPVNRGFEEFFGFLGGAHDYFKSGEGPNAIHRGAKPVAETEYLTDAFAREAISYIDRHAKEPFFLYLTFNAVHTPMQAPEKYLKRFAGIQDERRRTYAAMLSAMDDAVGAVLAKLRTAGIEDNTLIFFISDNGGPPVNSSSNGPLNGHKASTWEGGIRIPFFIQWKAKLPAGKTYEHPVIQMDIVSTSLAAAGVPIDPQWKLDGVDLMPHVTGAKTVPPHDALYWRFGAQIAVRHADWKLVKGRTEGGVGANAGTATTEGAKLFNLKDDIGEKNDLSSKHPDKVKELASVWAKWNGELQNPTWGPPRQLKPKKPKG